MGRELILLNLYIYPIIIVFELYAIYSNVEIYPLKPIISMVSKNINQLTFSHRPKYLSSKGLTML